jgi:tetratricopeptide (TPR) repeat protein
MNAAALLQQAVAFENGGDLASAMALYQKVLSREPSNVDALIRLGRAHLERGELEASTKALRRAIALRPQHGPALTFLGIALARTGQSQEAIACFERALAADPASPMTPLYMADVLGALGRHADAVAAFDKALAIDAGNIVAWHNRGLALEALGRDAEAAESFKRALSLRPGLVETHFSLANVLQRLQRYDEAVDHYRRTLAQWPDFARAHANLGSAFFKLHRWEEALQSLQRALALQPEQAQVHEAIGLALRQLQRDAESVESFEKALAIEPGNADFMRNKAIGLNALGRIEEARALMERAIGLRPREAGFYVTLSVMKRFAAGDPEIAAMQELLAETLPAAVQSDLHFALAKAYDDSGEPERAFPHLVQANALKRREVAYDERTELAGMEGIAETFTPALLASKTGQGNPSDRPIFVVGMPRSGTTLVEQILASHPGVFGAGEQKAFEEAVTSLVRPSQPGYPRMVPDLTAEELNALGTAYLSRMAALVPDDLRFTDKLPPNYNYVGLIHLALPNARIVHVQRDPIDTCLSIFSTNFADPPAFAYDLGELGRYYRAYERLMDHWRAVLPEGVMLEVRYEDVVADVEGQARRLLAHCGLAWDPACLEFHTTARPVRTASVAQVRQPIYRSSVARWRRYQDQLAPLLEALGVTV